MPDSVDAVKIASLDGSVNPGSANANNETNIDMVNPMPPSNPMPIICRMSIPDGNLLSLVFTDSQTNAIIPSGFPINKPAIIPKLLVNRSASNILPSKTIAVFANAKSGIMI